MSERMTEDWALYEMASDLERSERLFNIRFTNEEKECLKEYLKIYKKHLDICRQIIELEKKIPPHPQVNDATIAYGELTKVSKILNEEIQRLTQTATLQNVLNYRFAPHTNANNSRIAINKHERRNKVFERIKTVSMSILWSIIGLLEFYIVEIIAVLAIMLIHIIISYIPILNIIDEWLSRKAGRDIVEFSLCLGTTFAYGALTETAERILKNIETRRFTLMFIGVLLFTLNVIFLITNIINHDAILANIIISVAGIVLFVKGKST